MSVSITLQHQRRRKDIQVKSTDAVVRIMELAWKEFSVPVADQRLVYKGKSLSPDLRIEQLALITGAKMLVMGEPVLKSPDNHSKLFADLHRRYAELEAEFEATTDRQKVGGVGEECQRMLEKLDQMVIPQADVDTRAERKTCVKRLQQLQDKVDAKLAANL